MLGPFVLGVGLLCVVFAAFAGSNVLADAAAGAWLPLWWKLIAPSFSWRARSLCLPPYFSLFLCFEAYGTGSWSP